jgi:hypothetical protein
VMRAAWPTVEGKLMSKFAAMLVVLFIVIFAFGIG